MFITAHCLKDKYFFPLKKKVVVIRLMNTEKEIYNDAFTTKNDVSKEVKMYLLFKSFIL